MNPFFLPKKEMTYSRSHHLVDKRVISDDLSPNNLVFHHTKPGCSLFWIVVKDVAVIEARQFGDFAHLRKKSLLQRRQKYWRRMTERSFLLMARPWIAVLGVRQKKGHPKGGLVKKIN
jgi:hypothetical protein